MVADALERHYGADVAFVNPSVGGTTSAWGKENASALVAPERPDLVIVAFGMNDGSGTGAGDGARPSVFKANIRSIIGAVRSMSPSAEFVLVGTTLPNAETFFLDQQPYYYAALRELAAELPGVAAADMTGVHAELLKTKSFGDMTGNHVNHPNDFLSRWYAQFVFGMLSDRLDGER
jgi:lysophospholipase L1-like esterase